MLPAALKRVGGGARPGDCDRSARTPLGDEMLPVEGTGPLTTVLGGGCVLVGDELFWRAMGRFTITEALSSRNASLNSTFETISVCKRVCNRTRSDSSESRIWRARASIVF